VGRQLDEIEAATATRVAFLTRHGTGLLPTNSTVLQFGDLLHLVLPANRREAVCSLLAAGGVDQ